MKIKPEHFEVLEKAVKPLDTPERRRQYRDGNSKRADKVKDLSMRYRWDLSYAAGLSDWICNTLYLYANDGHVDTALRKIVPDIRQ